jgi:hypothetical protein
MTEFKLNVYDDEGNVIKTCSAVPAHFKFGAIRSLMELLNIDSIEDTTGLLKTIYSAWNELIMILNQCFPDMEYDDWENIPLDELVPTTMSILKYSFGEIMKIPVDEKNV